jgi:hypothetical protein
MYKNRLLQKMKRHVCKYDCAVRATNNLSVRLIYVAFTLSNAIGTHVTKQHKSYYILHVKPYSLF